MYNTGCLIFAHSILSTPVTSAVVRAPLRMMARWQSRAGMSLEFTPPLLHSHSQPETSNAITTSSLFLLGLLWLMLWVVIIILILWSPIKIVSISRLSSLGMHIFLGSHPISAITNECPISPSHEVLCDCYARPDPDAVLLVTSPVHGMMCCDWSYFNRGVPCALFVSHSKMCLWMDWKRISPVDLNGCDQVY